VLSTNLTITLYLSCPDGRASKTADVVTPVVELDFFFRWFSRVEAARSTSGSGARDSVSRLANLARRAVQVAYHVTGLRANGSEHMAHICGDVRRITVTL